MSLISAGYVRLMARYNMWQNNALRDIFQAMPMDELTRDRGAFFGSLMATANHLLWGDMLWMSRFDGGEKPPSAPGNTPRGIVESVGLCDTVPEWEALRYRTDGRIKAWAEHLQEVDLAGNLAWYSGAAGRDIEKPLSLCVAHFFNHQTHHRGQIHAMLTAAGQKTIDSDLFLMPEAP